MTPRKHHSPDDPNAPYLTMRLQPGTYWVWKPKGGTQIGYWTAAEFDGWCWRFAGFEDAWDQRDIAPENIVGPLHEPQDRN